MSLWESPYRDIRWFWLLYPIFSGVRNCLKIAFMVSVSMIFRCFTELEICV